MIIKLQYKESGHSRCRESYRPPLAIQQVYEYKRYTNLWKICGIINFLTPTDIKIMLNGAGTSSRDGGNLNDTSATEDHTGGKKKKENKNYYI
jgi:hypothetical protein